MSDVRATAAYAVTETSAPLYMTLILSLSAVACDSMAGFVCHAKLLSNWWFDSSYIAGKIHLQMATVCVELATRLTCTACPFTPPTPPPPTPPRVH